MTSKLRSSTSSNSRSGMGALRGPVGQNVARVDELSGRGDVGSRRAVGSDVGNAGSNERVGGRHAGPGSQGCPEVESLRGAQRLDGEDLFGAIHGVAQVERAGGAHADVVLLVRAGRDAVDRRRMGKRLQLVD